MHWPNISPYLTDGNTEAQRVQYILQVLIDRMWKNQNTNPGSVAQEPEKNNQNERKISIGPGTYKRTEKLRS